MKQPPTNIGPMDKIMIPDGMKKMSAQMSGNFSKSFFIFLTLITNFTVKHIPVILLIYRIVIKAVKIYQKSIPHPKHTQNRRTSTYIGV